MWVFLSPLKPPKKNTDGTYRQPQGNPHDRTWSPVRGVWKKYFKSPKKSAAAEEVDVAEEIDVAVPPGPEVGFTIRSVDFTEDAAPTRAAHVPPVDEKKKVRDFQEELKEFIDKKKAEWRNTKEKTLPQVLSRSLSPSPRAFYPRAFYPRALSCPLSSSLSSRRRRTRNACYRRSGRSR